MERGTGLTPSPTFPGISDDRMLILTFYVV